MPETPFTSATVRVAFSPLSTSVSLVKILPVAIWTASSVTLATSAFAIGASFVPVIIILISCSSVAPKLSVALILYVKLKL